VRRKLTASERFSGFCRWLSSFLSVGKDGSDAAEFPNTVLKPSGDIGELDSGGGSSTADAESGTNYDSMLAEVV
jgi:hypothetical protein